MKVPTGSEEVAIRHGKETERDKQGHFIRQGNQFTTPFGEGAAQLPVIPHKYRLLWAPACPWAHRAVIARALLGLDSVISLGTLDPLRPRLDHIDWAFTLDAENVDPVLGIRYISEAYLKADPDYHQRPTVPALVDIASGKVVQNDYHQLTYYFARDWRQWHRPGAPDLLPLDIEQDIRDLNDIIFHDINNGVYKAGFARSQSAYETAYHQVFQRLEQLEARLTHQRYLHGARLTDSDIRLYTTLVRFDAAYYAAFHVNQKRLIDYPQLWGYARDLYQTPGFGDTTDFVAIKQHYFQSTHIDPHEGKIHILPKGPETAIWLKPHGRDTRFAASSYCHQGVSARI